VQDERITLDLGGRERRLWDRLRGYVARAEFGERSGVRDLALLLPDLVVLLARLARDPRVPVGAKLLALGGVAYVLSPIELLPELLLGPLGLIDDLLVVAAALSRVLNGTHPDLLRSHWSGPGDALEVIQRLSGWAESLVVDRLPSTLGRMFGSTFLRRR
jgi:uncharacterized membrane protein YkvA (DUF1232 family)